MKPRLILSLALIASLISIDLNAEEDSGGHYTPGATASAFDAIPSKPGLAFFSFFTYYGGDANPGKSLAFGGNLALGANATVYAETLGAVYEPKLTLFGGSYATAVAIPYIWMTVKAQSELTGPRDNTLISKSVADSANGVGDISLYPFMLGWKAFNGDLKYDVRTCIYAPTGDFSTGNLANPGRNYWTVEPGASISWLSSKFGTEASLFTGIDLNTENDATHYQTGPQFHLDATLEQHLPLWGGFAGVGVTGYYYQQVSGDSGSGATLGDFEGMSAGVGPVVSYTRKIGPCDAFAEVKWLPEVAVENRTSGDYVWVKLGAQF